MNTDAHGPAPPAGNTEQGGRLSGGRWRGAAWVAAALVLLAPLIAMAFTNEVNWSTGDFVFAAVLLFGSLGAYELAARLARPAAYRAGAGVALVATVLLVWVNGAVGLTDSGADLLFTLGVPAVGAAGAVLARFRARGMAYAMGAMALAVAAVGVGAVLAGVVPPHNAALEVLGATGVFAGLFAGAALLFRQAGRGASGPGAD